MTTESSWEEKQLKAQMRRATRLPDEHLQCRSLGHQWRQVKPDRMIEVGEVLCYQCQSCLTIRDDVVSPRWGELLQRTYRHVPGYVYTSPEDGTRLFSAAALRAERVRRRKGSTSDLPEMTPIIAED